MNTLPKLILIFLMSMCACVGCAAEQPLQVFMGLKAQYVIGDAIEFNVKNTSSDKLLYWVALEEKQDREWFVLYSSIVGLHNDVSEPEITWILPGDIQVVRWVPTDDPVFKLRYQRSDSREYRFVVKASKKKSDMASPLEQRSSSLRITG